MITVTKPLIPAKQDLLPMIEEVMDSGFITNMGKQHELLEKEIKAYIQVENLSLFNNGAIALISALKALDLPKGSEVITTPFTFAATPHAISWNGLKPVFADIDKESMTLSVEAIERSITENTSAILPVHVYGFPCDVQGIEKLASKYNLKVIYDAAHAFTTEINGRSICKWGDITMLSFHATKLFNCIEGGALVYNDPALSDKIWGLRNFGIKKFSAPEKIKEGISGKDIIDQIGINGKLNELQACWGRSVLKCVKTEQEKRKEVAQVYTRELSELDGIEIPKMPSSTSNSYQYFPILIDERSHISRDIVYQQLLDHSIYARKYFYPLCSDFLCYEHQDSSQEANLPNAHAIANKVLCLPFYGELSNTDALLEICQLIRELHN